MNIIKVKGKKYIILSIIPIFIIIISLGLGLGLGLHSKTIANYLNVIDYKSGSLKYSDSFEGNDITWKSQKFYDSKYFYQIYGNVMDSDLQNVNVNKNDESMNVNVVLKKENFLYKLNKNKVPIDWSYSTWNNIDPILTPSPKNNNSIGEIIYNSNNFGISFVCSLTCQLVLFNGQANKYDFLLSFEFKMLLACGDAYYKLKKDDIDWINNSVFLNYYNNIFKKNNIKLYYV